MSKQTQSLENRPNRRPAPDIEPVLRQMRLPSPPAGLEARLLADVPRARSVARKPAGLAIASAIAAAALAACFVAAVSSPWTHVAPPAPSARQVAAEIQNEELSARLLASAKILAEEDEGGLDAAAALDAIRTSYRNTAAWREINQR